MRIRTTGLVLAVSVWLLAACGTSVRPTKPLPTTNTVVRVATFNTSLFDTRAGGLLRRLQAGDDKARQIAAVIQRQRPDILLLNEFDYDEAHASAMLFQRRYLEVGQFGQAPIAYPYRYLSTVNTGVPSGMDLDRNGKVAGPNDAYGFGEHPGQYGMLVLSKYPIVLTEVRSFQKFLWKDLPNGGAPRDPVTGAPWYPSDVWQKFRLSSKSHWDVPIKTPDGVIHLLAHHPTPPVFDGAEDRNGMRNHDEIRLWGEYITPGSKPWLCDDLGQCGGLDRDARFVIAGDHNADPVDGDSTDRAIDQLLGHARVLRHAAPVSRGAVLAGKLVGAANATHRGPSSQDTGDFGPRVGNLRLDYVLPSIGLRVLDSGVFWPSPDEPGAAWLGATDHHMVWMDLAWHR